MRFRLCCLFNIGNWTKNTPNIFWFERYREKDLCFVFVMSMSSIQKLRWHGNWEGKHGSPYRVSIQKSEWHIFESKSTCYLEGTTTLFIISLSLFTISHHVNNMFLDWILVAMIGFFFFFWLLQMYIKKNVLEVNIRWPPIDPKTKMFLFDDAV